MVGRQTLDEHGSLWLRKDGQVPLQVAHHVPLAQKGKFSNVEEMRKLLRIGVRSKRAHAS
jgi:hypothetical protein